MEKTIKFYNNNMGEVNCPENADYVVEERIMTLEEVKKEYPLFEFKNGKDLLKD